MHSAVCFTCFHIPCKRRVGRNAVASIWVIPLAWRDEGKSCSQCLQTSVQAGEGASSTAPEQSLLRAVRSWHRDTKQLEFLHHHFLLPVDANMAVPLWDSSIFSLGRRSRETCSLHPLCIDFEAEELLHFHLTISLLLRGMIWKERGCLRRIRCIDQIIEVIDTNTTWRFWVVS